MKTLCHSFNRTTFRRGCGALYVAAVAFLTAPAQATTMVSDGCVRVFCVNLMYGGEEQSTDAIAFNQELPTGLESAPMPSVALDAGDSNWLSLQVKGEEFQHQPLSGFSDNDVHSANVSTTLLQTADTTTGASFSPFQNQVPEPGTLGLLLVASVGCAVFARRRLRL